MKTLIKVSCVDQTLRLTNTPKIASGGVEEDRLHVDFCPMWEGFGKAAIFYRNPDEAYRMVLDGDGECVIPAVVLTDPGILYFAVYGTKDGVTRTSEVVQYRIAEGALTSAVEAPPDPPANVVDQLLQLVAPITELVAGKAEKVDLNAHMNNRTNPHRVTPEQIGASAVGHVHSPESIGAAPAVHTHTPESIGAAPTAHTHALGDIGAAAASHTHVPEEVGAEPAKLVFYDVVVPVDAWLFNSTHEDYPYRAAVALDGVDSSMIPEVMFGVLDASVGLYAAATDAYDGGVFLYASDVPPADTVIPTILIWSGDSHSSETPEAVTSVNGKTGAVNLTAEDVGARPASWVPTATEVGALPADTELPSTVGLASIEYVNQRTATMTGASADAEGVGGLVPAPAAGDENKVLSGSGAWIELPTVEGGGTGSGEGYTLPIATAETLGGVKPVAATADMTQPVGVDADGALYTVPGSSGGGSCDYPKLIARVITETDLDTIEIEGLNSTAAALSVRLYKTGTVTGNGICLAINGKQVSGAIGTQISENDFIPGVQMWIIRRGDDVIGNARMANGGFNNYTFKEFGNSTPIESIAVWSPYHITDATKYYTAGTIVEIYEGVYPNVK